MDLTALLSPTYTVDSEESVEYLSSDNHPLHILDPDSPVTVSMCPRITLNQHQNPCLALANSSLDLKPHDSDSRTMSLDQDITNAGPDDAKNAIALTAEKERKNTTEDPTHRSTELKISRELQKYVPINDIPPFHKNESVDLETGPLRMRRVSARTLNRQLPRLADRFSRTDFLPPVSAPIHVQMEEMAYRWAVWAAKIDDPERRQEVIKWIAERIENVVQAYCKNHVCCSDMYYNTRPGRHVQRTNGKRPASPSRNLLLSYKDKVNDRFGVTYGEITEQGLSLEKIRHRITSEDLDPDDLMLDVVLDRIGQNEISSRDWQYAGRKTNYNPTGRDLFMFCLYEVQQARKEILRFESLMARFNTLNQRKNTMKRIEEQSERENLCLAIALELNEKHSLVAPLHSDHDTDITESSEEDPVQPLEVLRNPASQEALEHEDVVNANNTPFDGTNLGIDERDISCARTSKNEESALEVVKNGENEPEFASVYVSNAQKRASIQLEATSEDMRNEHVAKRVKLDEHQLTRQIPLQSLESSRPGDMDNRHDIAQHKPGGVLNINSDTSLASQLAPVDKINRPSAFVNAKDVERAIPQGGLTGFQLSATFAGCIDQTSHAWEDLVRSVAYFDDATEKWYRRSSPLAVVKQQEVQHLDETSAPNRFENIIGSHSFLAQANEENSNQAPSETVHRQRFVITLRTEPGFDPEDFSSRTVKNHKGFQYRYLASAHISQRRSMDEYLCKYVQNRIHPAKIDGYNRRPRYGIYEVLPLPEDSEGVSIIHGYWDNKDGTSVQDAEWFYEGRERPDFIRENSQRPRITLKLRTQSAQGDQSGEYGSSKPITTSRCSLSHNSIRGTSLQDSRSSGQSKRQLNCKVSKSPPNKSYLNPSGPSSTKKSTAGRQSGKLKRPATSRKLKREFGEIFEGDSDDEYLPSG